MSPSVALLKPGQIFAERYRIERFLAQGGMGAVFVAEQIATELTVAIKVLFPHILSSATAIERFQLEARVAARVKSQHIVAVLDAGFDSQTRLAFLVMEYLVGEPLSDVVSSRGALSADEVVSYIAQCASGLDKAHGYADRNGQPQPIVHRDLKPENLFLTRMEDGSPLIKILDFGVAKVLSNTINLSQELTGTPLFMAYEQAGGRPVTPQTDIWALGLVSFYLLTRRYYWRSANLEGAELTALLGEVLVDPVVAPSARARDLACQLPAGAAYDTWFLRCVNREPSERYRTAGEAAVALGAALGVAPPTVEAVEVPADGRTMRSESPESLGLGSTSLGGFPDGLDEEVSLAPYVKRGPVSTPVRVGAVTLGALAALVGFGYLLFQPGADAPGQPGTAALNQPGAATAGAALTPRAAAQPVATTGSEARVANARVAALGNIPGPGGPELRSVDSGAQDSGAGAVPSSAAALRASPARAPTVPVKTTRAIRAPGKQLPATVAKESAPPAPPRSPSTAGVPSASPTHDVFGER